VPEHVSSAPKIRQSGQTRSLPWPRPPAASGRRPGRRGIWQTETGIWWTLGAGAAPGRASLPATKGNAKAAPRALASLPTANGSKTGRPRPARRRWRKPKILKS